MSSILTLLIPHPGHPDVNPPQIWMSLLSRPLNGPLCLGEKRPSCRPWTHEWLLGAETALFPCCRLSYLQLFLYLIALWRETRNQLVRPLSTQPHTLTPAGGRVTCVAMSLRFLSNLPLHFQAQLWHSADVRQSTQFDDHNGCHLELRLVCCVTLKTSSLLKDVFMQKKTSTVYIAKERQKNGDKKKDGPLFYQLSGCAVIIKKEKALKWVAWKRGHGWVTCGDEGGCLWSSAAQKTSTHNVFLPPGQEMGKDWRSAVVEKWAEQQGGLRFFFFKVSLAHPED